MSVYKTLTLPTALYPGDSFNSINTEASSVYLTSTAGERVALAQVQPERDISLEVAFSVNPGTFEVDLQTADTDVNGAYQTVPNGTITSASQTGSAGLFYARFEAHVKAQFARAYVKTQTANACTIRATITA